MVIEHAERFGLSQLHQLRGRVGRGADESWCLLIAEGGDDATERLRVFRDTNDGFAIAKADLRIRGQGDLFGEQQHGTRPVLRFADLLLDEGLLIEAQARARARVEDDPKLEREDSARVRAVLERRYADRLKLFGVA
jgi:ATP-dependent DNA helicase RecG